MSGSDSPTFFHGQPWSSWIEKIGRDKPLSDEEPDAEPASSVMRLSVDDIDLYGFCPERDTFYGVVCEICNSIVKPQALIQHMESRHPSGTPNLPPPSNSTTKLPMKTPYCKLSKLKKSQSSGQLSITNSNSGNGTGNGGSNNANSNSKTSNNHTPAKHRTGGSADQQAQQQTQQAQQPSSLHAGSSPRSPLDSAATPNNGNANPSAGHHQPTQQQQPAAAAGGFANALGGTASGISPVKSPGNQPKRKRLKTERSLLKDREYDPDRHCGVWNEETGKPCTRSLTCKAHTISLRRTVAGRSKSFDKLLADHRATKESPASRSTAAKSVTASSGSNAPTATVVVTVAAAPGTGAVVAEPVSISNMPMVTPINIDAAAVAVSSNSLPELDAPSSPPVLSLPDTYPLPQAVDLLYRCLAPHGSNKPTKLEEDFANELESSRRVESSVVNSSNNIAASPGMSVNVNNTTVAMNSGNTGASNAVMAPISVVLPSLSPIQAAGGGVMSPNQAASLLQFGRSASSPISMEQMIGKQQQQQQQQSPVSAQVAPGSSLLISSQPAPVTASVVLEAKTAPMDIDVVAGSLVSNMYASPVHPFGKEATKSSHLSGRSSQSPSSRSSSYSGLFDMPTTLLEAQPHNPLEQVAATASASRINHLASSLLTNGKQRPSNHLQQHLSFQSLGANQQLGRGIKQEYTPDYSTAIQLEATAASTPYATSFDDITWSSHHPEPLAVSKWLRITSSRKQYNFNIH